MRADLYFDITSGLRLVRTPIASASRLLARSAWFSRVNCRQRGAASSTRDQSSFTCGTAGWLLVEQLFRFELFDSVKRSNFGLAPP
jgi:hypothetical protein